MSCLSYRDQFGGCDIIQFKSSMNIFIHESGFLRIRVPMIVLFFSFSSHTQYKTLKYIFGLQFVPMPLELGAVNKHQLISINKKASYHTMIQSYHWAHSKNQRSALLLAKPLLLMAAGDVVDIRLPPSDLIISDPRILAGFASSLSSVLLSHKCDCFIASFQEPGFHPGLAQHACLRTKA